MIPNFPVSHEDDVLELFFGDDFCDIFGGGSPCSSASNYLLFEILFGGKVDIGVPEVVARDVFAVLGDDLGESVPVLGAAPGGARVVDQDHVGVLSNHL